MKKPNLKLNSVRIRLFLILGLAVILIILFLIILNNVILETFYIYSKRNTLISVYKTVNSFYNEQNKNVNIEEELSKIAIKYNFDLLLKTDTGLSVYTTDKDLFSTIDEINSMSKNIITDKKDILYIDRNINIKKIKDDNGILSYVLLSGNLDNGYKLYVRIPISSIKESVKISNNFLYLIGGVTIIIAAVIISYISKRFTEPILELNVIANNMSKLDFSQKYKLKDTNDEIDNLGKSINTMSDKLEKTIKQLRSNNIELEKDIEEKSKINEMRTQFISDVSHELKTPIALIQGYAEGLVENVNTDEESKQFYANVILDEANKMDKLVKQLLELTKLEYGKREFNNSNFNIVELVQEIIRKSKVMLEEKNIEVRISAIKDYIVYADEFYIEQVITNYLTNAIKNSESINNEKYIEINIYENKDKIRISVFNTGEKIEEENLNRIWNRFYKVDSSRHRDDGGTGIGLSLVKAIMNNYHNLYGVENKYNGVEFYFELDKGEIVE